MRIGANSGSLPKHLDELARADQAEALVEAALEEVRLLESLDFYEFKISVKSSHVPTMIRAYRMLSEKVDYPLHLGVTEAGTVSPARSRAPSGSAPSSRRGSATPSESRSPRIRSKSPRRPTRSSRRSGSASAGR